MLGKLINDTINYSYTTENFDNNEMMPSLVKNHPLAALITLLIMWIIVLLFGKFLWNNALVPLAPQTVKPAANVWQILGLSMLIQLLSC